MVTGQLSTGHSVVTGHTTYCYLEQAKVSVVIGQNSTDTGHTVVTGQLLVPIW